MWYVHKLAILAISLPYAFEQRLLADMSGIQYRALNKRKGPAVWGLRAQIDRDQYRTNMQDEIKKYSTLTVREDSVEDILFCSSGGKKHPEITGVVLGR